MGRKAVKTENAPPAPNFLSQAIISNGMVYCAGSVGQDPKTKKIVEGEVGARAEQALKNLSAILEEAGSSLKDVVKVNIFLDRMSNFGAVNEVYVKFFDEPRPARTCVAVKELPAGTDVEIECVASLSVPSKL